MAKSLPWLAPAIWTGGAVPVVIALLSIVNDDYGAEPVSLLLNQLGKLALITLLASLACTPLQLVFKWTWPARARKHVGLLAFGYAALHFSVYLFDQSASVKAIFADVWKRPFITVGFIALLTLVPLAWTSRVSSVKRLGYVKWKRLHTLVYVAAALGVLHFYWRVKLDTTQPMIFGGVLAALLLVRVVKAKRK